MAIYIKGMEVPENCGYCKFCRPLYHTEFCTILDKNCSPWKERKAWCPLAEVPEPPAEAEPTVIRSRTLMPTKDFKEWAKRVRETNPNAIVIPCDAEIVSAEAEEAVLNKMLEEEMIVLPQDYVKVVRCKDCRHRVHDEERNFYYCEMYYGQGDVSDENFCQWGERKES